jgi:DNA-binding PadR family transcriptional regulator
MPDSFLRPCLLLLIKERPGHGYDLVVRLKSLRVSDEPAGLYRVLRTMEAQGIIRSEWEFSNIGPARRVYHLTRRGDEVLAGWAAAIEDTSRSIAHYLDRYAQTCDRRIDGEPA